jgi:FkbM family methyltransferase
MNNFYLIPKFFSYRLHNSWKKFLYRQIDLQSQLSSGLEVKIENQAEWVIYNDIFANGEYDLAIQQTITEFGVSPRPLNILDIGANVGFFTLRLADLMLSANQPPIDFRVTLIEGSPTIYQKLVDRLLHQKALTDKITIVHGLAGERQGSAKLVELDFHVMNAITPNGSGKGVTVPYIDVSLLENGKEQIDLLKCDIEGAELSFLETYKDCLLPKVKRAVFELHHDRCDTKKCIEIFKTSGFIYHQKLRSELNFSLDLFCKEPIDTKKYENPH